MVSEQRFDLTFWLGELKKLGYPISQQPLDINDLREAKIVPPGTVVKNAFYLYHNPMTFTVLFFQLERLPTRALSSKVSRYLKKQHLSRYLTVFTDGKDSSVVVVPGPGDSESSKSRILTLSGMLYHTDIESINSLKFTGDEKSLRDSYDSDFLPYERVRKEFFEGYRSLYNKIAEEVKDVLGDKSSSYSQRFLGRIMFLYFLQKKGWLGGDRDFINGIKDFRQLNWLFYAGLATDKGKEKGLPFLNGSLFEREQFMTEEMENRLFNHMNPLFLQSREFFNEYNFTVDESSPMDLEVGIDPMLLGTVFESMLPENERGGRGTFYTPPEEASFICRKAISNYLGLHEMVEGERISDGISRHISENAMEKDPSVKAEMLSLVMKLLDAVVIDPAAGSGGFLLAMMSEMITIIHEAQEAAGVDPSKPIDLKNHIFRNLWGFDIEGEAIEIARLRLWLSMIIDEERPSPLPNLDINLVVINDSLVRPDEHGGVVSLEKADLVSELRRKKAEYPTEHDPPMKAKLRRDIMELRREIGGGMGGDTIEGYMNFEKADIVVMNPPYVRQESIPVQKKGYYCKEYGLAKKSDIYGYFLIRALDLVKERGVVSVISSDKWLETGYGLKIQDRLSKRLIAVYGQRERSFGADINSVIFVYGSRTDPTANTDFIYMDSYSSGKVRNHTSFTRSNLKPGKWFYLRAPEFFVKEIMPKLTHKLGDFAEIKFGIKTGANDFFYMKDISSQYEADRFTNPEKFKEWGVSAKNEKELKEQGLIYIENEGGERFVIEAKDVAPVVRSPTNLDSFAIRNSDIYLFKPKSDPGNFSLKYIEWGENLVVTIKKGKRKSQELKGINHLSSVQSNRPKWYNVRDLKPCQIIPNRFIHQRHFVSFADPPILAGDACALVYPNSIDLEKLWLYMNCTVFNIIQELYGMRMGGAALEILAGEFENLPVPNLVEIELSKIDKSLLQRQPLAYLDEIKSSARKRLDESVLRSLGVTDDRALQNLYRDLVEVVKDRLMKADRSLKSKEVYEREKKEDDEDDQDN